MMAGLVASLRSREKKISMMLLDTISSSLVAFAGDWNTHDLSGSAQLIQNCVLTICECAGPRWLALCSRSHLRNDRSGMFLGMEESARLEDPSDRQGLALAHAEQHHEAVAITFTRHGKAVRTYCPAVRANSYPVARAAIFKRSSPQGGRDPCSTLCFATLPPVWDAVRCWPSSGGS